MVKEALKRIFDFLEEKEGKEYKQKGSFKWKIIFNEPITQEDLNIKGDLNLEGSEITSLPKGLKVGGALSLNGCKHLDSLPEGLKVGGHLYLEESGITSLPKGLKVGGSLDLTYTKITSLPEGLNVAGSLDLRLMNITSLPKGLKVGGDLYIKETDLVKYTDSQIRKIVKPGFIIGEIYR